MKQRVKWLDVLKCFGIFLIYIGHFGEVANQTITYVFTHHVQLFFMLSGFAESLSDEKSIKITIYKVFKTLIIPWLLFSLLALGCASIMYNWNLENIKFF